MQFDFPLHWQQQTKLLFRTWQLAQPTARWSTAHLQQRCTNNGQVLAADEANILVWLQVALGGLS